MSLKRYCDMCGNLIMMGRYLTIEIKANRNDIKGSLSERDLCEECAQKVREFVIKYEDSQHKKEDSLL